MNQTLKLDSIDIDTKFLMRGGERRRPDVYCKFDNKEVAFEIQLSPLPQHYIQHRYQFYKKNNIYLIWILDIKGSATILKSFERDVKYIWKHQNLFILNEHKVSRLELLCHYKTPFNDNGLYKEKWYETSINLDKLKFDKVEISCFFYDYLWMKTNVETEILRVQQEEVLRLADVENKLAKQNAIELITSLRAKIGHWRSKDYNFYSLIHQINCLSNIEIEELNRQINLNKRMQGLPQFLFFIKSYKELSSDFKSILIELIFICQNLKFNINLKDKNDDGVIQYLYRNPDLGKYLYKLLPLLFKRRYVLTKHDKDFVLVNTANGEYECMLLNTYSHCNNDYELEFVKNNFRYIRFIKSAIDMNRLDSKVKSWVQYMMPIMYNYKSLWKYTKLVLARTPLGEELRIVDKKNTIDVKIKEFNLEIVQQEESCNNLLARLYPQIFFN
ncbi:DUF6035 family protein [Sphingobacterium sp. SG20118]|uniref:DUF6035 family protein n=1 Tax=Sphingobacterium sp. SG20118 TaxID=3367156 RepID=UPI0037DFC625